MAERAPKLEWGDHGPYIEATVHGLELAVWPESLAWSVDGLDGRRVAGGKATSLLAAQLAAEDASLQWLREGVEALGGRVLTSEQVALCVESLYERASKNIARDMVGEGVPGLSGKLLALAKELGDATP